MLGPIENLTAPIPGIVVAFLSPSVNVICNLAVIEIGVSLSCLFESAANAAIHLLFLPMLLDFCLACPDRVSPIGHLCSLLHLYTAFFVRQDAQMRNFCECNFLHCGIAVPQNVYVFWQILFVESCVLLTLHPVLLHPFLSNSLVREFDEDLRNCVKVIQRASKLRVAKKLLRYPAFSAISRVKWKRDPIFKKNNRLQI